MASRTSFKLVVSSMVVVAIGAISYVAFSVYDRTQRPFIVFEESLKSISQLPSLKVLDHSPLYLSLDSDNSGWLVAKVEEADQSGIDPDAYPFVGCSRENVECIPWYAADFEQVDMAVLWSRLTPKQRELYAAPHKNQLRCSTLFEGEKPTGVGEPDFRSRKTLCVDGDGGILFFTYILHE